jgi:hypothetical protein
MIYLFELLLSGEDRNDWNRLILSIHVLEKWLQSLRGYSTHSPINIYPETSAC